jgi:hypothetical protein
MWWHTPVVPAMPEAVVRRIVIQASQTKNTRLYLINNLKQRGLEAWLKWQKCYQKIN